MAKIALDMWGGDNAPECNIEGATMALKGSKDLELILVGKEDILREKTRDLNDKFAGRIEIVNALEVISPEEPPVNAIKTKKDSSLVVCTKLVKEGKADAFLSAGSSGAILAAGQLMLGRIKGVMRAPLTSMVPTLKGFSCFADCGANMDPKPEWLYQYAKMATIYMQNAYNKPNPSVKLINIGVEEDKGNELTKKTHELLKADKNINYQGFLEPRNVINGEADIIIADAFTGNAIIKSMEGTASALIALIKEVFKSRTKTKIAGIILMKPLKEKLKTFNAAAAGGAILLGLKGLVIKCHGNAKKKDICTALLRGNEYINSHIADKIAEAIRSDNDN